ncbi:MAG: zinc ribbon domain-containing protein [Candidatus Saccharicenans sp.]|nr:zinc ribbon domain-containing protein [Candidatus Saccharicenans sp.]
MRILYVRDRFLVRLQGKSDVLSVPLAQKIVQGLTFSAELSLPEEKPKKRSPTDALENVMTAAYAPIMEETESIQDELDELEKLHYEGKIPADEYQRKKMELLTKAMALSQKIGAGYVHQVQTFASQVCPNCGAAAVNVKFCPECGTKIPEETKCSICGTVLRPDHNFVPSAAPQGKAKGGKYARI